MFGLLIILEGQIAFQELEKNWQEVAAVAFVSLVAFDVVGCQEAFFSFHEVADFEVECTEADHAVGVFRDLFAAFEVVEGFSEGRYSLVPQSDFVVALS